jgi:hypothetical protein
MKKLPIFAFVLLLLFTYLESISCSSKVYYLSQNSGVDSPTCGNYTSPCATLIYIFSSNFTLSDNSIVNIESGSYSATNLTISTPNILLQATNGQFSFLIFFSLLSINSLA